MDKNDPRVAEILANNAHDIEKLSEQISDLIDDAVSEYISEFNSDDQLTYDEVMALYEALEAEVTRRVHTGE